MSRAPLAERINRADVHAFVALDTIDLLADHMVGLVGQGRRFTLLDQYVSDRSASLHDTGWRAQTSLRLDEETRYEGGVNRWEARCFPAGKGVTFHVAPGLGAFGISVYDLDHEPHNRTEEAAAAYYRSHQPSDRSFSRRRNVTLVRMQGWPGQPSRSDRILIEDWNDHGVCRETLVMFEGAQ